MSDVTFRDWEQLRARTSVLTYTSMSWEHTSHEEVDRIPDWAAVAVVIGLLVAIGGFTRALVSDSGLPVLVLALGLIVAAIGMRAAENAINVSSSWRLLKDG